MNGEALYEVNGEFQLLVGDIVGKEVPKVSWVYGNKLSGLLINLN